MQKNRQIKHIGDIENQEDNACDIEKVYGHKLKEIYRELIRFRLAIEQSIDGMAITDLELKLIYLNTAFARMYGYSPEEMINMNIIDLQHKEQIDEYRRGMEQIKTKGQWIGEANHIKKDETSFPVYISITLLKEKEGKPIGILVICRDITERKKMENEKEKLLNAVEITKEAVSIKSPDLVIIYANNAMHELFGYKKDELIGKHVSCVNAEVTSDITVRQIVDTIKKQGYWEGEILNKRKDGTKFITYATTTAIKDKNGKIISFISTQHDITKHKKAEEALKESEARFRMIADYTHGWEMFRNVNGKIIYISPAFERITGYKIRDYILGKITYRDLFHPDDLQKVKKCFSKAMRKKTINDAEFRIIKKGGALVYVSVSYQPVITQSRKFVGVRISIKDITERKQTEEEINQTLESTRIMLENMPCGVVVVGKDKKIRQINKVAQKMMGLDSPKGIIGKICHKKICPAEKDKCPVLDLGQSVDFSEKILFGQDNKEIPILKSVHTVTLGDEEVLLEAFVDITERKRAEGAIKEQQMIFKRFSREILSIREAEKKKISTNLHDEVGSIGISLSTHLSIIKERIKDKNLKAALKGIRQAKNVLEGSIASFKNIVANLRPPDLDIIGLPDALKAHFSKITKHVKVKIDFRTDKNIKIVNDDTAIALYRVAQEALSNIVKHAKAKNVKVRLYSQENNLKFNVCDDGKGFDMERSLQTSEVLKMGILGMRERVESLGGVFIIESAPKRGTKISITVPSIE
ncbi:MAG: PAS domain S-box protein [Candidatus Omnitrophota bacterium]|nr:MAG: PAS domain S-box protein [Candidatus Omnitrophota bacterium]